MTFGRRLRTVYACSAMLSASVAQSAAQSPAQTASVPDAARDSSAVSSWIARRLGGQAQVFSEVYGISGQERRRPGSTWRVLASPRVGIIGGTEVGLDLLLSSEGNEARQSINQVALEPSWGWGQLHLGDFAKDYSPYTMTGLRIRGAGLDIERWGVRASVQGGRSAALIPSSTDGPTYRRQVIAGAVGIGREGERSLDLRVVRAQDNVIPDETPVFDTLGIDTLPADLRPQQRNRPQENVVVALGSALRLFQRKLSLKGEIAGALLTRDLTSPEIDGDSVDATTVGTLRTSSSGDAAWNVDAAWQGRSYGIRGGYEQIGAGFTSLGLAYLVNDRRSFNVGGDLRLLNNAMMVQGRFQRQENNLASQRIATTTRDVMTGTATMRLPADLTLSLVALVATAGNSETNDTLRVDNQTSTLNASVSRPWRFAGRNASLSLTWSTQATEDLNPIRLTPKVSVQTANMAASVPLFPWLMLSPAVSAVLPSGDTPGENVLGSLRLSAQGLKAITASSQFTQTFVSARQVTTAMAQFGYLLPGDINFSLQARWMRFGPQGVRPAFDERFLTTTLGRSF
ncbi:MAG: hypothetical protein ACKVS7_16270 [Gemmatimonadaceae bacterium]